MTQQEQPARRGNRRSSRRQRAKGSAKVTATRSPLDLGRNIAVELLDLSETGARVVLIEALPVGHTFHMTLYAPGGRECKAEAVVARCDELEGGRFVVGARFAKPIPYIQLQALVRP